MTRCMLLALLLPLIALPAAAEPDPATEAREALRSYFAAMSANDWPAAWDLLSKGSRGDASLEEYAAKRDGPGRQIASAIKQRTRYEYGEVRLLDDGERAEVDTTVHAPSLQNLLGTGRPTVAAVEEAEIVTSPQTFVLLREEGAWKVHMGASPQMSEEHMKRLERAREMAERRSRVKLPGEVKPD